ncbi:hypothetical protein OAK81_02655 [Verrucomicrobiales bacterium]|nr:hypothetical protein [Verrucomicrobiales bacterium]MDC0314706.1 hypothetical protein [bacterium]
MTSQDSWIDQDEINQLVNSIEGKKESPDPTPEAESPLPEENATVEDSAAPEESPDPEVPTAEFELSDAPPEDADKSDGFVFALGNDDGGGDDVEEAEEATTQESPRQPQVVQALAEVRNRANRGGLLKSAFQKGPSPLWPDFPPLDDEKPKTGPEPEFVIEDLDSEDEQPVVEAPVERPKQLRKRLEDFADTTVTKFDATGFSITDFSGYQLLQRGNEDTLALSAAASLVTDQINQLSEAVGAPELGSTQISLSDDRWLCLVEAQSSAGGILAQLQLPEPMTSSATSSFRRELEAVLAS